eukprot:4846061-Prymnesium_polylepis.1
MYQLFTQLADGRVDFDHLAWPNCFRAEVSKNRPRRGKLVECKLKSANHVGDSEKTRDVYLLAKIHEIHHTKIHEDTLAAHIGRRYTFFGILEALFRIEELHTRVLSGSKNFTARMEAQLAPPVSHETVVRWGGR